MSGLLDPVSRLARQFGSRAFRRVTGNAGLLLAGDAAASVLGLVSLSITTRVLEPAEFGVLVLISTYVHVATRLATFQSWQAVIKFGAEHLKENQRDGLRQVLKQGVVFDVVGALFATTIAIAGGFIGAALFDWAPEIPILIAIYSASSLFNVTGTPIGVLRLFDRFRLLTAHRFGIGAAKLAFTLIAASTADLTAFVIAWAAAELFGHLLVTAFAIGAARGRELGAFWRSSFGDWRPFAGFTIWTNLSSSMSIPVKQLDIFVVSALLSLEAVAAYKIVKQVGDLFAKLANPFWQAIYPEFSALVAEEKRRHAIRLALTTSAAILIVALPIAAVLSASAPWWLGRLFGPEYAQYWPILILFLLFKAVWAGAISITPLFIALGYARKDFVIVAWGNLVHLALAVALTAVWGLAGTVLGAICSFLLIHSLEGLDYLAGGRSVTSDVPLRVLLWAPRGAGPHYWGPGTSAFRLYGANSRPGVRVFLAHGYRDQSPHEDVFDGHKLIHPIQPRRIARPAPLSRVAQSYDFMRFLGRGGRWLREHAAEFDVMHALTGFQFSVGPAREAERAGLPAVVKVAAHERDLADRSGLLRSILVRNRREWLREVSGIVAISSVIRDELLGYGVDPQRIALIPNGVDTERFRPADESEKGRIREVLGLGDWPVVLFVGAIYPRKRPHLLVEAARELALHGIPCHVVLVGPERDGVYAERIRRSARDATAPVRVTFTGHRTNVESYYKAADVFVLPSAAEGMANAVLEAMAAGLPIVASRVSGMPDMITPEVGDLVDADAKAIAASLVSVLGDRERKTARSRAARDRAESVFAAARVFDAHLNLFHSVRSGGTPASASLLHPGPSAS